MCSCTLKLVKLILFVFNVAFFLLGAAAIALGVFLLVDKDYLLNIIGKIPESANFDVNTLLNTTSYLQNGAYMLIVAGSFIFVIAFCGLCGGIRESPLLLYIYIALVALILIIQLSAGVLCKLYGNRVETYLVAWFTTLVKDYYAGATIEDGVLSPSTDTTGISDAIDFAQISLGCCGVWSYYDYHNASNWPGSYNFTWMGTPYSFNEAQVPLSCCKMMNPSEWPLNPSAIMFVDLNSCLTTASYISTNLESCYEVALELLKEYSTHAVGFGVGVVIFELFGIISAVTVIRQAKR